MAVVCAALVGGTLRAGVAGRGLVGGLFVTAAWLALGGATSVRRLLPPLDLLLLLVVARLSPFVTAAAAIVATGGGPYIPGLISEPTRVTRRTWLLGWSTTGSASRRSFADADSCGVRDDRVGRRGVVGPRPPSLTGIGAPAVAVIEVEGLRKEYRRPRRLPVKAVDGLDLSVPDSGVFGFVGPNGSGRTTTIRCLLGLIKPDAGRGRVLGVDAQIELPSVIARVGALVETPGLFPGLTARQNLALQGRLDGIGAAAVTRTLDRVGLAPRADDFVRGFSLGMRQRLGLGVALLKDPQLLILDEPANGLDPAGVKEVRDLLLSFGREGRTVFVSSHLLSEVQQTCDNVAILAHGRCVASGSVQSVLAGARGLGVVVRLAPAELPAGLAVLGGAGMTASIVGDQIRVDVDGDRAATVTKVLADHGLYLSELRAEEADLETAFLQRTEPGPG